MTDESESDQNSDDKEYAEAYGFWVYAYGVIGAVIGYNIGSELELSFWANIGFGFIGLLLLSVFAYIFRKVVSIVGAVIILILIVMAVIEGIQNA